MKNAITRTSRYYKLYNQSQNEVDSNLPSKKEIVFLLDSDASISVRIIPTYKIITQLFNVRCYDQLDTSKTLTTVN